MTAPAPRILVIEDNDEVRDNLADILTLAGYRATQAAAGKEGIELATSQPFDLILCDVMMPGLDGFGVLKILGEREDTRGIPFVFVTAKSEHADLRRGMNLGADDYVTKPFYKDELLRVIEVRLRRARVQRPGPPPVTTWSGFLSAGALADALGTLLDKRSRRAYRRGEAVFREGDSVRDVFVLKSGFAKHQNSTDFGKTLIVYVFRPGDLFGYPEAIAKTPYQHDAVALTDIEVDILPAADVRAAMASDPNVADLIIGHLAHGLLDADRRMMYQAYLSVRERCAQALLRADETFGSRGAWPMSREELAQWAGTAKETFIRNLTEFRNAGLVEAEGNVVRVVDGAELRQIAG